MVLTTTLRWKGGFGFCTYIACFCIGCSAPIGFVRTVDTMVKWTVTVVCLWTRKTIMVAHVG